MRQRCGSVRDGDRLVSPSSAGTSTPARGSIGSAGVGSYGSPRGATPAGPPGGPVVSRLAQNAKLRPTVEKFVVRLARRLEAMDVSLSENDFEALAGHAHWLKGAGGTVGFDAFTGPAEVLEQQARDGKADEAQATIDELRGLADRIDLGASP